MKITRRFTTAGKNVYDSVEWARRTSRISNADGSVVFEMKDAEMPKSWSQLAVDIMVSKYFRKAGVPEEGAEGSRHRGIEESAPEASRDREGAVGSSHKAPLPDGRGSLVSGRGSQTSGHSSLKPSTGPEKSARQVIHRLAGCWTHWGKQYGYFATDEDAQAFYDELAWMMLTQVAAPNSPQWFNTGLNWAYGISGPPQGHWIADHATGTVSLASDAYTHPQPHACFIQSVNDDLVNPGGIMDLWVREARLFKYGSGTGTNFSSLRGENENLSGGGKSSGLMSWLRIGDRAAGAIKSGGTTRRAAKMVCLNADHPDIEQFINWKVREEIKVAALVEGMKHLSKDHKELAESLGLKLDYDFNGEAYYTVSGQNSNNSVRLTDEFFRQVDADGDWTLTKRTDGKPAKTLKARDLWRQICAAAWRCADPGLQFDSTINAWHTCPNSGRINASNPCSEYMFLDNTACNLASINVLKFYDAENRVFDLEGYEHAIRLWTIVLEISVLMASFPSQEIAELSWKFRTLGLGYANLGAMLMQAGIPYDSEEGRAICGMLSAIMTGRSYAASAEMAAEQGPFPGYAENRESMLRVIRNHRLAAHGAPRDSSEYEQLHIRPVPINHGLVRGGRLNLANAVEMLDRATRAWDDALELGMKHGYRNAQTTVIAPTGTIGLLMDCDTTGVEPDFALVKFKKLAGGGYFKIANASLRPALHALGYDARQIDAIVTYVMGTLSLETKMPADAQDDGAALRDFLVSRGYRAEELVEVENALPTVFEIGMAFNAWSMPERVLRSLGVDVEKARKDPSFNGLKALGLSSKQIEALNLAVCGTQTVEGAPFLKPEHLPVFDCANKCGKLGQRFIATSGHIRMMAAAQPFISGAISKTINLPNEATVEDIAAAYRLSWELGLKANALYRDGCKLSQPLSTKANIGDGEEDQDEDDVEQALGEVSTAVAELGSAISTSLTSSAVLGAPASAPTTAATATTSPPAEPEIKYIERIVEKVVERPLRRRLTDTRESITHKFNVAGHEGYLIVGLYEDGSPGELFITMAKEGSTIGGLMDSLGTAISVALQYGVPMSSLVKKFEHQRFEPMGMTTNPDIPFAKSLVDYIFRWMGMQFIDGYREQNAPDRRPAKGVSPAPTAEDREDDAPLVESKPAAPRMESRFAMGDEPSDGGNPAGAASSSHAPRAERPSGGLRMTMTQRETQRERIVQVESQPSVMNQANASLMGDAPACDVCGSITVRNGTCYKCLNCGNSMGCS
ncbi:MAG: adenosylcobalamin-dependent ribonucleoside-diphosphate reductase [Phycisphaeraceae bacterium]|nr:MAG: adenosylcobalamin-dependent ribonucleoside-diphosphate reductase [Phycisphaeraceae bacterium]